MTRFSRRLRNAQTQGAASGITEGPATPQRPEVVKQHFMAALAQFKAGRYEDAVASFAAVEAESPPALTTYRVLAKARRAGALFALNRWSDALVLLDELVADKESLAKINRERFPDEVATIYSARAGCLEMLQRWPEARECVTDLIEEVQDGNTPTQRFYLADAYLLRAKAAVARRDFSTAFAAIDASLAQCASGNDDQTTKVRRQAEELYESLKARVRTID